MKLANRLLFVGSFSLGAIFPSHGSFSGDAPSSKSSHQKSVAEKPVAGKADVLKHVQKKFAKFLDIDFIGSEITLHIDGDSKPTTWKVAADAEIKIHGWWGRIDQLQKNDRVWVWFNVNRQKKPKSILMIADEISEQDTHSFPTAFAFYDKSKKSFETTLSYGSRKPIFKTFHLDDAAIVGTLEMGDTIVVETSSGNAKQVYTLDQIEKLRTAQKKSMKQMWRKEGLPGQVSFLHPLSGEMDLIMDHEAMRWARYLKPGDEVTIEEVKRIKAVVKRVEPWRERTLIRLVTNSGLDQLDLTNGQRILLKVPEPPKKVQASDLPTDIGRAKTKAKRIAWVLASTYCTCQIANDVCTGMFYTLSSCNTNSCGMPNKRRGEVAKMIDKGLSDRQIIADLQKKYGRDLMHPHLKK